MAFLLQFVRNGSVLVNLVDGTNFYTVANGGFKRGLLTEGPGLVRSQWQGGILGASADATLQNLIALQRVILDAQDNYKRLLSNRPYTPIWLQMQVPNATHVVQTEVFADDKCVKQLDQLLETPILGNVIEDAQFEFLHRFYAEEYNAGGSAPDYVGTQVLQNAQVFNNNGALIDIPNTIRGDLPAPLQIKTLAGDAARDYMLVALRAPTVGTVGNFLSQIEAESYNARGSGVADLTDATFSPGSGVSGQRWTPGSTSEIMLLRMVISSNILDQMGPVRVLAAVRDNATGGNFPNVQVRVKPFTLYTTTSTFAYGDWGGNGYQQYANAGGSAARVLIDCGTIIPGGNDTLNLYPTATNAVIGFELWGQAKSTSFTFDVDCFYILPEYDAGNESGFFAGNLPAGLGATTRYGVIDANDRVPMQYELDNSGNPIFLQGANYRGAAPLSWPNRAQKLIMLLATYSTLAHNWNVNSTVTVTATPRYRIARGTS